MSLPLGYRARLGGNLITSRSGDVLVGGSPLTAVRLSPAARDLIRNDTLDVEDAASARLTRRLLATNLAHPDLARVPPAEPAQLTVVVPVRDRSHQLDRALAALAGLRRVVVDDASHDPQAVEAVCVRHGVAYIPLEHNVGPAAARNIGLARVTTPYVAFVDSDVQVAAADLLGLTRHFADPTLCLVGPRVVGRPLTRRPRWFERYDAAASSLTLGTTPGNVRPGAAVAWLPSACLVARVDLLGAGFDAGMRVGEDVDLVWRLIDKGLGVRYDPSVTAHHDSMPTLTGWLGRKYVYGTGGAPLAARHGSKLAPAILSPLNAAAAAALLLRARWSPLLAAAALVVGTRQVRAAMPASPGSTTMAARIAVRGLGWATRQESALAVRHWWPAAVAAAGFSRHARRVLVSSLVVDSLVTLHAQYRSFPRVSPAVALVGRRFDDLAYGAGLWSGALRQRSVRVLLPRRP